MANKVAKNKEEGLEQVKELVRAFDVGKQSFMSGQYNETQFRNDFLDTFLKSFGWDVDNNLTRSTIQDSSIL